MNFSRLLCFSFWVSIFAVVLMADSAVAQNYPISKNMDPTNNANMRHIMIGNRQRDFTDDELKQMATQYTYVIIEKFTNNFNIETQKKISLTLKKINPQVKVLLYYNLRYWFELPEYFRGYSQSWNLRDKYGSTVYLTSRNSQGRHPFADLGDPEYRRFAILSIQKAVMEGSFDGVVFDSAVPLGQGGSEQQSMVNLPTEIVSNWNNGMLTMLKDTKAALGPGRIIAYNGINPQIFRAVQRNLALLNYADAAFNEGFCLNYKQQVFNLKEDILLMQQQAARGKMIFQKTNYPNTDPGLGSFCYAAFLMGYVPDYTFFKYGRVYLPEELIFNPKQMAYILGKPVQDVQYKSSGEVGVRQFTRAVVYVNLGQTEQKAVALTNGNLQINDGEFKPIRQNETFTLLPKQAAYLLKSPKR